MINAKELPALTKQDATCIILKCMIAQTEKLFDERHEVGDNQISPDNLKILREVRDKQIARLRENLTYANKQ